MQKVLDLRFLITEGYTADGITTILISLCRVNGAALEDKSVCLAFIVRYSTRPIITV